MKEKFTDLFNKTLDIAERYDLSNERDKLIEGINELADFKVTAPIVGGFSTGKSSLINALIGENILSTNITPETAIPAEITYGNDTATIIEKNSDERTIPLSRLNEEVFSANKHSLVKIKTSNRFFEQIPMVKLVDMPGFDSGIEIHNKAIDDYLPKSLAYILTVAADEGTLRESIIQFLNELKYYNMSVYAVITKSKKVTDDVVDETKQHIEETIKRFLKTDSVKIAVTNAKGKNIDIEGFKEILIDLQKQSKEIMQKYFSGKLRSACIDIEKYLMDRLKTDDMSIEQLQLEKEKIEQNMQRLEEELNSERTRFSVQIQQCVASIKDKISSELNASASVIESMLLQGTDIKPKVNAIIRNAVSTCIQTELEPKIQKYIGNVAEMIDAGIYGDTEIKLDRTTLENNRKLEEVVSTEVAPAAAEIAKTIVPTVIGSVLGETLAANLGVAILGPIGLAVGALVGIAITIGVSKSNKEKEEKQRQEIAHQRTQEIISSLINESSAKAEAAITAYVAKIDEGIAADITAKKNNMEKALADAEDKLNCQKDERAKEKAELEANLKKVRGIINGI